MLTYVDKRFIYYMCTYLHSSCVIGPYMKKDPVTLREVETKINSGMSCEQAYISNNKEKTDPNKILSLKNVQNLKYNLSNNQNTQSETEMLLDAVKKNSFIKVLKFEGERYTAIAFNEHMLSDIKRFCVDSDSILCVDTTFDVIPGLWITDTSYECSALVSINNRHPHFPGPMMLHFKKDKKEYRTFSMELVNQCESLLHIKKIGHDLDKATAFGFSSAFPNAQHVWCTQHLQNRTLEKLKGMHVNQRLQNKIMADLYGIQDKYVHEDGLADAEDEEDLNVKLASLEDTWREDVSWFAQWFRDHQFEIFSSCLTMNSRKELGIHGRFYNNHLESKHRLQKKKINEILGSGKRSLMDIVDTLNQWVDENFVQEVTLAVRGILLNILGLSVYRVNPRKIFDSEQLLNREGVHRA